MIAVKRLQSLFWVFLVALGALGAYMVSLRVATERNELRQVQTQIAQTRADIRYLELEFQSRANMRQLEKWNAEDFRYSALTAEHYLDGERALAKLDGLGPDGSSYTPPPVMVAMMDSDDIAANTPLLQPAPAAKQDTKPGLQLDIAVPTKSPAKGDVKAANEAKSTPAKLAKAQDIEKATLKAERVALLDARLLDDRTLTEISRRADSENGGKLR